MRFFSFSSDAKVGFVAVVDLGACLEGFGVATFMDFVCEEEFIFCASAAGGALEDGTLV